LKSLTTTLSDVKCSVSCAIADTSACRTGYHAPPNRSVCATGQRARSSSHTSGACWAYSGLVWSRSVAQSVTGGRASGMPAAYGPIVDVIVAALEAQQAELDALLEDRAIWSKPSRCDGWSVADVVLHLAQTNEMAVASANGTFARAVEGYPAAGSIDEGADLLVQRERHASVDEIDKRWKAGAAELCALLRASDPHARLQWVAGSLAARTLATTRLAETWIHTNDVAPVPPSERLQHIAHLAWRTIPYAFQREGREPPGPTAFRLDGVDERWELEPDAAPVNVIEGDGVELCHVASRRLPASEATTLKATGPQAAEILTLVRTWA